ncbi:hypothetical protein [Agromyces laixinhei]|uniref:hypothetical protein n=1 Tax=Agromyces laixinhei TaxID=2585717 RepID=UPI0011171AF9|nr:hypothetical protein [Agromyces laixinhei]
MTRLEAPRRYKVFAGDQLALDLRGESGLLVSTSAPPPLPGVAPVTHPFATAVFRMAENEGELGELLREAADLDSFLDLVRARGYRVEPGEGH